MQFKVNCSIKKFRVEARALTCNVFHDTFNQLSHELAQLTLQLRNLTSLFSIELKCLIKLILQFANFVLQI